MNLFKKTFRLLALTAMTICMISSCDSNPVLVLDTSLASGKPSAVSDLSATSGYSTIVLSWSPVDDVDGYLVYRIASPDFGGVASSSSSSDVTAELASNGFSLLNPDDISSSRGTLSLTDSVSNGGYIYTVVSYTANSSGSLSYSYASDYAEGCAVTSEALTLHASSGEDGLSVSWAVDPLYSVLSSSEALYDYGFELYWGLSGDTVEWSEDLLGDADYTDTSYIIEEYESGTYDFLLVMNIYDSGSVVNTVSASSSFYVEQTE